MAESVVEITDTPPDQTIKSSCFLCGLKFGLLSQAQRKAHLSSCMDTGNDESPANTPSLSPYVTRLPRTTQNMCPTCDRDLSSYTDARRAQHVNRCVDSSLGLPAEDSNAIRSAHIPDKAGKRRKNLDEVTGPSVASMDPLDADRPPPLTMSMMDKDYVCPICNKKIGGEFRTRVNHVNTCAAKNGIDAERLGQLKREQEASLTNERVAWEERHPEFQRGNMTTSQPPVGLSPPEKQSHPKRPKRRVSTTAIAAHEAQLETESALRPFFPSQFLDGLTSQDRSMESHQLTWISSQEDASGDEEDAHFKISESGPSARSKFGKGDVFGENTTNDDKTTSPLATQAIPQSRLQSAAPTSLHRLALSSHLNVSFNDDEWDAPSTQALDKKRRLADLPSSSENQAKKPKSSETCNFTGIGAVHSPVIILDSPANSQETPALPSTTSYADTLGLRPQSPDTPIHEDKSDTEAKEEEYDDDYWMKPLAERIAARRAAATKTSSTPPKERENAQDRAKTPDSAVEEDELSSSPPTPPLDRCITPPRRNNVSVMEDFIDLSSPVRVTVPRPQNTEIPSHPARISQTQSSIIESNRRTSFTAVSVPEVSMNDGLMDELAIMPSKDETPFHTELDTIITKFHQLEKQAEETYYATLGRISVQKDQQIRQLAAHFSVDMATATRALLLRSAKITTGSDIGTATSPLAMRAGTVEMNSTRSLPSAPLRTQSFGQIPSSSARESNEAMTQPEYAQNAGYAASKQTSSVGPSVPRGGSSLSDTVTPPMSRANSGPNHSSGTDGNNAIQRPNFDKMTNAQLVALASKFGLQSSLSRSVLISQLEAIWQHYKMQFSSGVDQTAVSASVTSNQQQNAPSTATSNVGDPMVGTSLPTASTGSGNEFISTSVPKRTRAKATKASSAVPAAASANLPSVTSTVAIDPTLTTNEKLDQFVKGNIDLYSTMLHYTSVDVVEFQEILKSNKLKVSRQDIQQYLQSRGFLYSLKKTSSGKYFSAKK